MAAKMKGIVQQVDYSLDYVYPDGNAAATWVNIPVSPVLQENAVMPGEEPVGQQNLNGQNLQSGVNNTSTWPVILDDDDTFMAALKTASSNHDPVWLRVQMLNQTARVIGGLLGCQVMVGEQQAATFGNFVLVPVTFHAVGADADDTFELVAAS